MRQRQTIHAVVCELGDGRRRYVGPSGLENNIMYATHYPDAQAARAAADAINDRRQIGDTHADSVKRAWVSSL